MTNFLSSIFGSENENTFWTNKPTILYSFPNFLRIIPFPSRNYIYNLNALTRLFIFTNEI